MTEEELLEDEEPIIVELRWDGAVCLVDVEGEVDLASIETLKAALEQASTAEKGVILNLPGVSYMDSSGFATLLEAARNLKEKGKSLHLVGPNTNIARLMEITRLSSVFQIHETEDAARQALGLSSPLTA